MQAPDSNTKLKLEIIADDDPSNNKPIVVYITCGPQQAEDLARILVTKKAAACVNIVGNVRSIYRWQNKIEEDNESMLIIKTTISSLELLSKLVKQHHEYDLPEIIAIPIVAGSQDYLSWINSTTINTGPNGPINKP